MFTEWDKVVCVSDILETYGFKLDGIYTVDRVFSDLSGNERLVLKDPPDNAIVGYHSHHFLLLTEYRRIKISKIKNEIQKRRHNNLY